MGQQLSLLDQRRRVAPHESDERHVRALAQDLVSDLGLQPPINFDIVASYQGVDRIEVTRIPWAGCLLSEADRLVIKLRAGDSHGRRRFTAPHEITHTFFPGFEYQLQYRCTPHSKTSSDSVVEWLCDVGASELLFPTKFFAPDVASSEFGFGAVEGLAGVYDASFEATARAYVSHAPDEMLLLILEHSLKPSQFEDPTAAPKLRVQSFHPGGCWPFIRIYKSVSPDSPFGRALNGEVIDERTDIRDVAAEILEGVHMTAKVYPYRDEEGREHRRVMALIRRSGSRQ